MNALAMTVLADTWGWHHSDMGIGWSIMMVIFWGAIIALVVWAVRGSSSSDDETPDEILRRRLADGSIGVEEYEQRRAALENTGRGGSDELRVGPPSPGAA